MNIALINKETNICENIAVFDSIETANNMFNSIYNIIEESVGYGIGDIYVNKVWSKFSETQEFTNSEKREQAYQSMIYKEDGSILIEWESVEITVDKANQLWIAYSAEGSTKAEELSVLIANAKTYIRELYPDEI